LLEQELDGLLEMEVRFADQFYFGGVFEFLPEFLVGFVAGEVLEPIGIIEGGKVVDEVVGVLLVAGADLCIVEVVL
jgi:hypothetical protein